MTQQIRRPFIRVVLALAVVMQLQVFVSDYAVPWLQTIQSARHRTARQRSAEMSPHILDDQATVLEFLQDQTPSNGTLVFADSDQEFSWKPYLQYFLHPRRVIVCQTQIVTSCLEEEMWPRAYLVEYPHFPPLQEVPAEFRFHPVEGLSDHGFYSTGR